MQTEDGAATEGAIEESLEHNQVVTGAMDAIHGVTDGNVTSEDLVALWTHIGWPIVKVIVLILVVLILASWARRIVLGASKRAHVEVTLSKFLANMARWGILLLGGITILQTFGIEATSFAAVLAALGFAIGMAMSGTLGNVASGVMLLIFRPFKVGDFINAAGVMGTIDEIGLFTTTLDTPDNRRIIVPNGKIFGDNIENVTFHETRRCDVAVGVDYGANIQQTRETLMKAAQALPQKLDDPEPVVFLNELGDSAVTWAVRVWVNSEDYWAAKQALTELVKNSLDEAGIGIPFPQMDVHLDGSLNQAG